MTALIVFLIICAVIGLIVWLGGGGSGTLGGGDPDVPWADE